MTTKITVNTTVIASIENVWKAWTTPNDILQWNHASDDWHTTCLLYTSPSPRDRTRSRMPSSA